MFGFLGLNKVYMQVASFNSPAIKLLEADGFKLEATLRDHHYYKGEFFDNHIYSQLLFEVEH